VERRIGELAFRSQIAAGSLRAVRLLLLGAFPFPAPQGSQCFAAEQARALGAVGAETRLYCYGSGDGRRLPGVHLRRIAAGRSPDRLRAGFDWRKPSADRALVELLVRDARREPFDAVLAHNAEAALVALAARSLLDVPVVYVAHTLWAEELSSYLPRVLEGSASAAGFCLDTLLARASDAVMTLSRRATTALAPFARGPLQRIPPPLLRTPAPGAAEVARTCRRHALEPGSFAVYAGNLDAYQDLELLDCAAARARRVPVVAVTHDPRGTPLHNIRKCVVRDPEEARCLIHAARLAVLPRRRAGGFPIKLLHYMEAGRPILAHADVADTLEHGTSGWLLPQSAGPELWAAALCQLFDDAPLGRTLGAGAAQVLAKHHAPSNHAADTLALVSRARGSHQRALHLALPGGDARSACDACSGPLEAPVQMPPPRRLAR